MLNMPLIELILIFILPLMFSLFQLLNLLTKKVVTVTAPPCESWLSSWVLWLPVHIHMKSFWCLLFLLRLVRFRLIWMESFHPFIDVLGSAYNMFGVCFRCFFLSFFLLPLLFSFWLNPWRTRTCPNKVIARFKLIPVNPSKISGDRCSE